MAIVVPGLDGGPAHAIEGVTESPKEPLSLGNKNPDFVLFISSFSPPPFCISVSIS